MIFKISFVCRLAVLGLLLCAPFFALAQSGELVVVSAENLADDKKIWLDEAVWKYRPGDDAAWAAKDFDDSSWETIRGSKLNLKSLPASGWNGRAWFRLHFRVDESAREKQLALVGRHWGAAEIYLDGQLLEKFGEISERGEVEYNPNFVPTPFKTTAGDHVFAVRYSASVFADPNGVRAAWLASGNNYPGFSYSIREIGDFKIAFQNYANSTAMRFLFFFVGVLATLALLHLLLFVFYRVERANLFYGIYAFAFAVQLACNGFLNFLHLDVMTNAILNSIVSVLLAIMFVALLAFLHIAFDRPFNPIFWAVVALWLASAILGIVFARNYGIFIIVPNVAIFATFTLSIYLLVEAAQRKLPGAWILIGGVQIFALSMLASLLRQLNILNLPADVYFLSELGTVLGVPVAVSIYLARNFARTNRNLAKELETVERLSAERIEQERIAAELRLKHEQERAENERRAKELEEARQLQLSLLPKKLPQIENLEIAAYMKPATEVGGDYYDFYLSAEQTLTIAVGDATGHGLKAGTMVTATKSLFNNLAPEPVLPEILKSASAALKKMNLRGMFMALTMARLSGNRLQLCQAGMPPALLYRRSTGAVEEFASKALPLGSPFVKSYVQEETVLAPGDCLIMLSDGFPEMFNERGEMLGFDKAMRVLPEIAHLPPQQIINRLVEIGEQWAGARAPDDDVTMVVLRLKAEQ